jgi:hypothetical protein
MEENLAIRTTEEITVMLLLIFQLYRLHQTITAINQAAHLDHLAAETREMDMAVAVAAVAEQRLPLLLYLLLLNHLKGLLCLNRWILLLAMAMVVEAGVSRLMVERMSIIVARAVAAMMVDQVAETIMVGIGEVETMTMEGEVVDKDKGILDKAKDKASNNKAKVNKASKVKVSKDKARVKVKVVQRGKGEVKGSLVDMRVRGEGSEWTFPLPLLCKI